MKPTILLVAALSIAGAQASWFSNDPPEYTSWSKSELKNWLKEHNIDVPSSTYSKDQLQDLVKANWNSASAWTHDQYATAQQAFAGIQESAFDAWDESRLREFLLEQGVVAPSGPREQLVLLAKQKYRSYTDAASAFSSRASASASSAIYGDSTYQASKSLSSIAAQATKQANQIMDDSKDYVYSTWDDNRLRSYLEEKGYVKTKTEKKREELLAMMRDAYVKVTNPVWEAWSTSYIHAWLVDHGIIKSDFEKNRDALYAQMQNYYYDVNDPVWSTWTDSQLKSWLIEHDIIKSDAQIKREKMLKLIEDNYANAVDTLWSSWSDNQIRDWLIENGYMRSDAQVKRDEMVKMINEKYKDVNSRTEAYLTWPDARLRAYLRERGVDEGALPTGRPGLLQEVRIRWVQTTTRADNTYKRIMEIINNAVHSAEDKIASIVDVLMGYGGEKDDEAKAYGDRKWEEGKGYGSDKWQKGRECGGQKVKEGREYVGEKVKKGGEKVKGEL